MIPAIIFILILLLVGAGLVIILVRLDNRLSSIDPIKIQVLVEALYQTGYSDQKAGRPEMSFEAKDNRKLNRFQREINEVALSVYRHGRQDALEGKPSVTEEISENRKKQIAILKEMTAALQEIKAKMNALT